jgi:predicted enzyme related to lactoylglutathione lyase
MPIVASANTSTYNQHEEHSMSHPGTAFSHVGICVLNMERSFRFYTEALGFVHSHTVDAGPPFDKLAEAPDLKLKASFLKRDGVMIELLCHERPATIGSAQRRPMNQLGLTHLSFTVTDLAAVTGLIEKHGGFVYSQTLVHGPLGDMIFCTDPDGTRVELWEKKA